MSQIQYNFNKNDEYRTPAYAVYPILKRLKKNTSIWCPFDKSDSQYVKVFQGHGFHVVYGHIQTGQDFFDFPVPSCDYIVSNPPDSRKGEVFQRLFELQIPFAMLINFQGIFDQKDRFEMFRQQRIELLWLSPRVNYDTDNQRKSTRVPFQSCYLCQGICKRQLEFDYLDTSLLE